MYISVYMYMISASFCCTHVSTQMHKRYPTLCHIHRQSTTHTPIQRDACFPLTLYSKLMCSSGSEMGRKKKIRVDRAFAPKGWPNFRIHTTLRQNPSFRVHDPASLLPRTTCTGSSWSPPHISREKIASTAPANENIFFARILSYHARAMRHMAYRMRCVGKKENLFFASSLTRSVVSV
jgi:hypothetical protein